MIGTIAPVRQPKNPVIGGVQLLDDNAELKLRTPCNVFIGGQILDRGITVPNLIGFYYGRSPRRMQQDTVLQHARMYGARARADLSVTRFYTTAHNYMALRSIHEFDSALRHAFETGAHDRGVAFVVKDHSNRVIPCAQTRSSFRILSRSGREARTCRLDSGPNHGRL